jgi:hypothetical protein
LEFLEEEDLSKVASALLYSTAGPASGMPIDYALAPFQKIFKLEKFLPNYSEDVLDRNIVAGLMVPLVDQRVQEKFPLPQRGWCP